MSKILYLVIPCYNEEEVLPLTKKELKEKMDNLIKENKISKDSKVMFVNDGSKDKTWKLIEEYHNEDPLFVGVKLSRNKGHQNALLAGLMTAKKYADITISMDADLQDDINVIDKSVVAAKGGTVVTSEAAYGSIPAYDANGNYIASYRSYGEYIIINHHDGTMTLYGHLKPGSRLVSEGDTVQQGQVIATVGNTGNCQPRPSASNPYNGTHLHFEVRINGRCVNPIPYLP